MSIPTKGLGRAFEVEMERRNGCPFNDTFWAGAAVAFGLMGMAEAIRQFAPVARCAFTNSDRRCTSDAGHPDFHTFDTADADGFFLYPTEAELEPDPLYTTDSGSFPDQREE